MMVSYVYVGLVAFINIYVVSILVASNFVEPGIRVRVYLYDVVMHC